MKSSKDMISYKCSDDVITTICEYMCDEDIVSINEKKAMFHLQGTCGTTGDGMYEGLVWLSKKTK